MLHQKLLVGNDSYYLAVGICDAFELHRHPETELSFCLEGQYSVEVENKKMTLKKGDLLIVKPMEAHSYSESLQKDSKRITLELGPAFLGAHFPRFAGAGGVLHLDDSCDTLKFLNSHLLDLARLYGDKSEISELKIRSSLYAVSALVLEYFSRENKLFSATDKKKDIEKIERSLEIIYKRYDEQLDLDLVCKECGYSKSSFCRIFKRITGDTFHDLLNRHRVQIACLHLEQSSDPIEDIAAKVGFSDSKSFCRVFKNIMHESPGSYRKSRK